MKKERRAQYYLESPYPSPRCRGESSHATRRPIDRLAFLKDSDDKPPRRVATLGIHFLCMRTSVVAHVLAHAILECNRNTCSRLATSADAIRLLTQHRNI
ncbi:hypothetical protein IG631_16390 [Alternaria alternata]|nr:hypothetical protein IG631_16390 [Alternaria alternata]